MQWATKSTQYATQEVHIFNLRDNSDKTQLYPRQLCEQEEALPKSQTSTCSTLSGSLIPITHRHPPTIPWMVFVFPHVFVIVFVFSIFTMTSMTFSQSSHIPRHRTHANYKGAKNASRVWGRTILFFFFFFFGGGGCT